MEPKTSEYVQNKIKIRAGLTRTSTGKSTILAWFGQVTRYASFPRRSCRAPWRADAAVDLRGRYLNNVVVFHARSS